MSEPFSFSNPSWMEAIGTIGAVLFTLILVLSNSIMKWWKKPIIDIKFENTSPYCKTGMIIPPWEPRSDSRDTYAIRLKIINSGRSTVKKIEGKLNKIIDEEGNEPVDFDPTILHWAGHNIGPIQLNSSEYDFLEVVYILRTDTKHIHIISDDPNPRGKNMRQPMKNYIFDVSIYGENIKSITKQFSFLGSDKYNLITLNEIKK